MTDLFNEDGRLTLKKGMIEGDLSKLTKKQLIALVKDIVHDWYRLNTEYNKRATYNNWCEWYEQNQAVYNRKFRVLQLRPRRGRRMRKAYRGQTPMGSGSRCYGHI